MATQPYSETINIKDVNTSTGNADFDAAHQDFKSNEKAFWDALPEARKGYRIYGDSKTAFQSPEIQPTQFDFSEFVEETPDFSSVERDGNVPTFEKVDNTSLSTLDAPKQWQYDDRPTRKKDISFKSQDFDVANFDPESFKVNLKDVQNIEKSDAVKSTEKAKENADFEARNEANKDVAKSEYERLKNTPGTKEYNEAQANIKLGEGNALRGSAEADLVNYASKEYLKRAGITAVGSLAGGPIGQAFSKIPGINNVAAVIGEGMTEGAAEGTFGFLNNVFSSTPLGGEILATMGTGTAEGVYTGSAVEPSMWKNAIDNVGLGETKLGQFIKSKLDKVDSLDNISDSDATEIANEIEKASPEEQKAFAKSLAVAAKEAIETPKSDNKDAIETPKSDNGDFLKSLDDKYRDINDLDFYQSTRSEVKNFGAKDVVDFVLKTVTGEDTTGYKEIFNNIFQNFDKDAANTEAGQSYIQATNDLKAKLEEISQNSKGPKSILEYGKAVKDYLTRVKEITQNETAAGKTIDGYLRATKAAVKTALTAAGAALGYGPEILARLFADGFRNATGDSIMQYLGIGEDDYNLVAQILSIPDAQSEGLTKRFEKNGVSGNDYNKGLTKESDEKVKGYIRTVVRGQPHVRNLANKLRK